VAIQSAAGDEPGNGLASQLCRLEDPKPRPLEDVLGASLAARRFQMLLLGIFATVALIMAAIGVYAVMAEVAMQRTHEIRADYSRQLLFPVPEEIIEAPCVEF